LLNAHQAGHSCYIMFVIIIYKEQEAKLSLG